jgi:hypothetical protein
LVTKSIDFRVGERFNGCIIFLKKWAGFAARVVSSYLLPYKWNCLVFVPKQWNWQKKTPELGSWKAQTVVRVTKTSARYDTSPTYV